MGNCPFCNSEDCTTETKENGTLVVCKTYGTCLIGDSIKLLSLNPDKTLLNKLYCKIIEILVRKSKSNSNKSFKFSYAKNNMTSEERINLYDYISDGPTNIFDRVDNALLNLSYLHEGPGEVIDVNRDLGPIFYCSDFKNNTKEICELLSFMKNLNYIMQIENLPIDRKFSVSPTGWIRILELRKKESACKQGFIAMSFSDETRDISQIFSESIKESGYTPMRIDQKEHNNQIVPEILHEISKSKFLVIDLTYPNYGAYYEAGYALGLGKEVIACCRKKEFDDPKKKPHFDLYQKNMVVWTDLDDLKQRLIRRIEATIK